MNPDFEVKYTIGDVEKYGVSFTVDSVGEIAPYLHNLVSTKRHRKTPVESITINGEIAYNINHGFVKEFQ
jgi:long-subunit fatty acid transport protein